MDALELFRQFKAAAQAAPNLTDRERMFIGLAVTLTKSCEP